MFYLIALGLIVFCLLAILAIVVRRLPDVADIDTSKLTKVRDRERKRQIINARFGRLVAEKVEGVSDALSPRMEGVSSWFSRKYQALLRVERRLQKAARLARDPQAYREELMADALALLGQGNHDEAEKRLIELVSIDSRDAEAYRLLGDLYLDTKDYEEAREIFAFLVRMGLRQNCGPEYRNAEIGLEEGAEDAEGRAQACNADVAARTEIAKNYANLGIVCRELGLRREAMLAFENAAAFEPANPRYLDLVLEACILEKQKIKAKRVFRQLTEVNPENNKLPDFAEAIAALD